MKNLSVLIIAISIIGIAQSCKKKAVATSECEACNTIQYAGSWEFIVNNDNSTLYSGQIYQYNDSVLNIHYQEEDLTVARDDYYKQLTVEDCESGIFRTVTIPHGNTGGWTKKEGSISGNTFSYLETSRHVHYVTGEETFSEKTITGVRIN